MKEGEILTLAWEKERKRERERDRERERERERTNMLMRYITVLETISVLMCGEQRTAARKTVSYDPYRSLDFC